MAKSSQSRVAELVEVLIIEMNKFEKANEYYLGNLGENTNRYTHELNKSIQNLKNVKVNVDGLKTLQAEHQAAISKQFDTFHNQFKKDNHLVFSLHKKMRSKQWYTVIILGVFFFSTAVFSSYHALKAKVRQDDYEVAIQEKLKYESDAKHYKAFITRNQKTIDEYIEWAD